MENKKLRCYNFDYGEECDLGIIAYNLKQAKRIGMDYIETEFGLSVNNDIEFTDIKVKWRNKITTNQCEQHGFGVVDDYEKALQIGIYDSVSGVDCVYCDEEKSLQKWSEEFIGCEDCFEKHQHKSLVKFG